MTQVWSKPLPLWKQVALLLHLPRVCSYLCHIHPRCSSSQGPGGLCHLDSRKSLPVHSPLAHYLGILPSPQCRQSEKSTRHPQSQRVYTWTVTATLWGFASITNLSSPSAGRHMASPSVSTNLDHLSFSSPKKEKLHFMWMCLPAITTTLVHIPQTHLVDPYQIWRNLAGYASHLHETPTENKDATAWLNPHPAKLSTVLTASPELPTRLLFLP